MKKKQYIAPDTKWLLIETECVLDISYPEGVGSNRDDDDEEGGALSGQTSIFDEY